MAGESACLACSGDVTCLAGSEWPAVCPSGATCGSVAAAPTTCAAGTYSE